MKALIAAAALFLGLGMAVQSAGAADVVVKKVTTVHRVYHPVHHRVYHRPVVVYHRPVVRISTKRVYSTRHWHVARVCHWTAHRKVCLTSRRYY
ncbi:MAG TPA: hypothetical protein VGG10_19665 [Rhizomicrobium sp.]